MITATLGGKRLVTYRLNGRLTFKAAFEAGATRDGTYWFAPRLAFSNLSYTAQDSLPNDNTSLNELGLPILVSNQTIPYRHSQANLIEVIPLN